MLWEKVKGQPLPTEPVLPAEANSTTPVNNSAAPDEQNTHHGGSLSSEWVGFLIMIAGLLGLIFAWIGSIVDKPVFGWDTYSPIIFLFGFATVAFYKKGANENWDGYGWMAGVAVIGSIYGIRYGNWVPFRYSIAIALLCGVIYVAINFFRGSGETKNVKTGWESMTIEKQCGVTGGVFTLALIVSIIVALASGNKLPVVISFPIAFVAMFIIAFVFVELSGRMTWETKTDKKLSGIIAAGFVGGFLLMCLIGGAWWSSTENHKRELRELKDSIVKTEREQKERETEQEKRGAYAEQQRKQEEQKQREEAERAARLAANSARASKEQQEWQERQNREYNAKSRKTFLDLARKLKVGDGEYLLTNNNSPYYSMHGKRITETTNSSGKKQRTYSFESHSIGGSGASAMFTVEDGKITNITIRE